MARISFTHLLEALKHPPEVKSSDNSHQVLRFAVSINYHRSTCSTDKNKPQGGGEATPEIQKQTQGAEVTALLANISKLQQEKTQLQKEKDELQTKLDAKAATKGSFWKHGSDFLHLV